MALARVTDVAGLFGTILASRSTMPSGNCSTRPTSRSTARRLQGAEGDDLGDAVAAVLVLDVGDHLLAPFLAEVDVEVGHGHPLGIEEALEEQVVAQGVQAGDQQDQATSEPAPDPGPAPPECHGPPTTS